MPTPSSFTGPGLPADKNDSRDRETWETLHRLAEQLSLIEQRLGTSQEQEEDQRLAREIGHDIRNQLNLLQMRADFRAMLVSKAPVLQHTA